MNKKQHNFDFMAHRKTFWLISLSIFAIGIIFNIIFGVELDISFTGGSMFKYSYSDGTNIPSQSDASASDIVSAVDAKSQEKPSGSSASDTLLMAPTNTASSTDADDNSASATDLSKIEIVPDYSKNVDRAEAERIISAALGEKVTVSINTRISISENDSDNKNLVVTLSEKKALDHNADSIIRAALQKKYPNVEFSLKESNSVDPNMGGEFLWKCVVAVILASLFMVLYVGLRFKKIGGWSAGVSSIIAIIHDCLVVYFAFVIFGFPIDDNFIAVVLAIIGYSLNSTIVIFDRIRENRKLLGTRTPVAQLANISMNETLGRTINTNLCVFAAVAVVAIISVIFGLDSIISFAVPMMFGTVSGCYSSLCISNSLWVTWQEYSDKRNAEKHAAKLAEEAEAKAAKKQK